MRWDGFARSVVFAAVAAASSAAWLLVTMPFLGGRLALALFLVALVAVYLGGLGERRRGVVAAGLAAVVGLGLLIVAPGLRDLMLGLAVVLGVGRSVFLHRRSPARAVMVETVLLIGGLLLAALLASRSVHGIVLAVWGFFLVQSLFFLIPGAAAKSGTAPRQDAFTTAHARLVALLERDPV